MVEEFDVIDTVFGAINKRICKKYVDLFKAMPKGSFVVEWSLDNPYVKAEKETKKYGICVTRTISTGGFILRSSTLPRKTLIVMFPSATMGRVADEDIDKIRCHLNFDFYHEFIHYIAPDLNELRVESVAYVLCMQDCINLDCKHLVGLNLYCNMPFDIYEMEDPDEIPILWDEEWEKYYEKIREKLKKVMRNVKSDQVRRHAG